MNTLRKKLIKIGAKVVRHGGRNPMTGEEAPILPRHVLVFRASHVLKNQINEALSRSDG